MPSGSDTTDGLLTGLVDDLDEGFAELVKGYQQVLYSVALRVSGRTEDAEDLAKQASLDDLPELPADGVSVERQVELGETRRALGDLLARLPENQRLAVVLRHVAGLPMAEIASVMRIPEGTAKSHASRGLSKLRSLCGRPVATAVRGENGR